MEPITVLRAAAILLGVGAVGGAVMAVQRMTGRANPPHWLAMLHGFLGAAGLTLMLYMAATSGLPALAGLALLLFLLAAGAGIWLNLNYHLKNLVLPLWLMLSHAGLAVIGYLCLLLAAFSR